MSSNKAGVNIAKGKSITLHIQVPELYKPRTGQDRPHLNLRLLQLLLRQKRVTVVAKAGIDPSDDYDISKLDTVPLTRVDSLEEDLFQLSKVVMQLTEADQRRKFLGTSSARAPFVVKVNAGMGVLNG